MTAELYNLKEERKARNVRTAEKHRKGQSVKQIIHDTTYVPNSLRVAGEAVASLFERLKGIERGNASELVDCVLCHDPIKGVTKNNIADHTYYADGGGPLHPRCYKETYTPERLREAEEWAEKNLETLALDRLRDY